jgi:hypothetical protein
MHTIKLDVKSRTTSGSVHGNLFIDDHDTGPLYLTEAELKILASALKTGCQQSNIIFEQTDVNNDEFEYDLFDD